jgi:hypothetical protein
MSINLQNGGIAFIIVGAILLLIGLIGGGIEIKDMKVPKIGKFARIGIVFFGVILLLLGLVFSVYADDHHRTGGRTQPTPTPQPSVTWNAIINGTTKGTVFTDPQDPSRKCVANAGEIYLAVDVSLVNISNQTQVLSDDLIDLHDNAGGHYNESQCASPYKEWSVNAGQSIHLGAVFLVPDVESRFILSIMDKNNNVDSNWDIGCK